MEKILILDNYDSFTYNLAHLVKSVYKGDVIVKRDYEINLDRTTEYSAIIISPGPGKPKSTPMAMDIIQKNFSNIPILGICLGMQCINEFFGGNTVKADYPIHGKRSILTHDGEYLFDGIPNNIHIARYHSLVIEPAKDIIVVGRSQNVAMAIKHRDLDIYGLQFHPESFLSEYGDKMIRNFFELTGIKWKTVY